MKMRSEAIPIEGRRSMYGGIAARLALSTAAPTSPTKTMTLGEIDARCSLVLEEISKCKRWNEQYIESSVLHNVPQTFVPSELCVELEAELDRLLTEQILREERERLLLEPDNNSPAGETFFDNANEDFQAADADECTACGGSCTWNPFCNADDLTRRKKTLYRELKSAEKSSSKTMHSVVARSALNGGETIFVRTDLIREISDEIKEIESKLKLNHIDTELHDSYASKESSVSIRSIHGYPTTVKRQDAIWALEHEHQRHVAQMAASETIDSILEWMLEGWYFGIRDQKDKRQLEELPSFDERGTFIDKASSVQWNSDSNAIHEANANANNDEHLKGVETNMKYGLFCLTFMYFRMLHLLHKSKSNWDGSNDLVSLRHGPPLSEERMKMIQEEKNAEFRRKRIDYAMEKAKIGEGRKMQRLEKERLEKAKIREWENRRKQAEQRLATTVQRVFRGHLGRKIARQHALEKERAEYAEALANDCATDIARVWRGYCGRLDAGYLRAEMAKFLCEIREEEARDELLLLGVVG